MVKRSMHGMMESFEQTVKGVTTRISINEFIDMASLVGGSSKSKPHTSCFVTLCLDTRHLTLTNHLIWAVRQGGGLLAMFIAGFGPFEARRLLAKAHKLALSNHTRYIEQAIDDQILNLCRVPFANFLLNGLAARGVAGNQQLFYRSLLLQFRGASRNGLQILSVLGVGLPPTTFDRYLAEHLEVYESRIRCVNVLSVEM
jgi:hypothetical protein